MVNPAKCEVTTRPDEHGAPLPDAFDGFIRHTTDDFDLLGTPCGSDASVVRRCERAVAKVKALLANIKRVPHPQMAYALMRYCGAFPLCNYLARAAGPVAREAFAAADRATQEAFDAAVVDFHSPLAREALRLPPRHGGMGLRSVEATAPLALVAASVAGRANRRMLMSPAAVAASDAAGIEPRLAAALAAPEIADSPAVRDIAADLVARDLTDRQSLKQQRVLCRAADDRTAGRLLAAAPREVRARLLSASVKHASSWLTPLPGTDDPCWIEAPIYVALARYRYREPLQPEPSDCRLCGAAGANDVYGEHTLLCNGRGSKWKVHNAVRNSLARLAGYALMSPQLEPSGLLPSAATNLRPDMLITLGAMGARRRVLLDVTIVNPLAVARVVGASRSPGYAAEQAALEKVAKYGPASEAAGFEFVPFAGDNLGAFCAEAQDVISRVACAWGRRCDLGPSRAVPIVAATIISNLVRTVGELLLLNSGGSPADVIEPLAGAGHLEVASSALSRRGLTPGYHFLTDVPLPDLDPEAGLPQALLPPRPYAPLLAAEAEATAAAAQQEQPQSSPPAPPPTAAAAAAADAPSSSAAPSSSPAQPQAGAAAAAGTPTVAVAVAPSPFASSSLPAPVVATVPVVAASFAAAAAPADATAAAAAAATTTATARMPAAAPADCAPPPRSAAEAAAAQQAVFALDHIAAGAVTVAAEDVVPHAARAVRAPPVAPAAPGFALAGAAARPAPGEFHAVRADAGRRPAPTPTPSTPRRCESRHPLPSKACAPQGFRVAALPIATCPSRGRQSSCYRHLIHHRCA